MYNYIDLVDSYQLWRIEQFEKQKPSLSANLLAQIIQAFAFTLVFHWVFPNIIL